MNIINNIPVGGASGSSGSGLTNTPNSSRVTTLGAGTVAAGAKSVTFETSEDFLGDINGVDRQPSRFYTFSAKESDVLAAIPYTINSGNLIIDKLL